MGAHGAGTVSYTHLSMGEALSVHYSGGSTLNDDIATWFETNGL